MNTLTVKEKHIVIEQDQLNVIDCLVEQTGLSRSRVKHVMQCGAVWLTRARNGNSKGNTNTQRLRRAKTELRRGDELHLYYNADIIDAEVPPATLFADEGEYSVWFKPAGMYTQGTKWGDHHTIVRWAEKHLQPERIAKIVHRLDRATSGLIILAHSKKAAALLSQMFQNREIEKHYHATVHGIFGEIGSTRQINDEIDGKHARSDVTVLATNESTSLLNVHIHTGRKHQVRRHLSENGFPIVGDNLYGIGNELVAMKLHSNYLAFNCPILNISKQYCLNHFGQNLFLR